MYWFVVIAFAASALWLLLARPLPSATHALVTLGVLSYAGFAILSGAFWVGWPRATAQLVPGHVGAPLVVAVAQARGLIVIALGLLCIVEGNPRRTAGSLLLGGPAVYNLMMSSEALAAQFTELFTAERWLYVTLHFLWAVSLALRAREDTQLPQVNIRALLVILAVVAIGLGLTLLTIPYDFQTATQSAIGSSFTAHAVHGFGSGLVATGALAAVVSRDLGQSRDGGGLDAERLSGRLPMHIGAAALMAIFFSLAVLALVRASELGPLQAATRSVAFVCLLGAGALCLTLKSTRT